MNMGMGKGIARIQAVRLLTAAAASLLAVTTSAEFHLTLLHTNDVHSRYEQTDDKGNPCSDESSLANKCFGGVARRYTMVEQLRQANANATLLLDAGDQYQGTLWFVVHGANITAHFMKSLRYDAMTIGNHEFDLGMNGLAQLVDGLYASVPVLACNMNTSKEPSLKLVKPYVVITRSGRQIGVIGYTLQSLPSVTSASNYGNLSFADEVESVRAFAAELRSQNVSIIIALGHSGYEMDQRVAAEVEDVDVVVGGHSHTFLYSGPQPSNDVPSGPYPTVVNKTSGSGRKALVVQAFQNGKYLGHLRVTFNDSGELVTWAGSPITLHSSVPQDSAILEDVARWGIAVRAKGTEVVGKTTMFLNGAREECGLQECSLGSVIADAFASASVGGRRSLLAVFNAVSIGTSIGTGPVLYQDVLGAIPYQNTVDAVTLRGQDVLQMFEISVSEYSKDTGKFLQVSGFRISYDISKAPMSRVASIEVRCSECANSTLEPLNVSRNYTILMSSYMAAGGGGYTIIRENKLAHEIGPLDADIFIDYFKSNSPVENVTAGRIRVAVGPLVTSPYPSEPPSNASTKRVSGFILLLGCLTYVFQT